MILILEKHKSGFLLWITAMTAIALTNIVNDKFQFVLCQHFGGQNADIPCVWMRQLLQELGIAARLRFAPARCLLSEYTSSCHSKRLRHFAAVTGNKKGCPLVRARCPALSISLQAPGRLPLLIYLGAFLVITHILHGLPNTKHICLVFVSVLINFDLSYPDYPGCHGWCYQNVISVITFQH